MTDYLNQNQKAGDHSTNVQALKAEIHHHGLTVPDVRQICMDLFEANFYRLQSAARETAEGRAKEITERFLQELNTKNRAGLEAAADPDMQAAIFTAQRDYARFGTKHLEDVLVDLLVERTSAASLRQIVLNEAIATASKLTAQQLDLISVFLLLAHNPPIKYNFKTWDDFKEYAKRHIAPLLHPEISDDTTYLHLKSTACSSQDIHQVHLVMLLTDQFPDCFSPGFERMLAIDNGYIDALLVTSFHNPPLWQLKPMDDNTFLETCHSHGLSASDLGRFRQQRHTEKLNDPQLLISIDSRFQFIPPAAPYVHLSTVGIALANANLRRRVGLEFDLGHWIK